MCFITYYFNTPNSGKFKMLNITRISAPLRLIHKSTEKSNLSFMTKYDKMMLREKRKLG